ncbi:hypothetical protein [Viridibacillus sp. FSL H8-0123]|uniref:hypothetical protein n=1 Tax=Viridibacillus sp. FSL H8-0123 TaxID=1928922 RepID=UPI00096FCF90|nr:hypothetical protein [Viridibacillus sp. FSL H8-0123]OMC83367.1 hypothetical protein BK130_07420 [Viridibacillus sp. FSL H8-0123]
MTIEIVKTSIQFKNPIIGKPTLAIEEHYYARRITAIVDELERPFRFMASEIALDATEEDMIEAIEIQLNKIQSNAL